MNRLESMKEEQAEMVRNLAIYCEGLNNTKVLNSKYLTKVVAVCIALETEAIDEITELINEELLKEKN